MGLFLFNLWNNHKKQNWRDIIALNLTLAGFSRLRIDINNHGGYLVFHSDCYMEYFPILIEKDGDDSLYKIGSVLFKDSNSLELKIVTDNLLHQIKIPNPEKWNARRTLTIIASIFAGIVLSVMIILPKQ